MKRVDNRTKDGDGIVLTYFPPRVAHRHFLWPSTNNGDARSGEIVWSAQLEGALLFDSMEDVRLHDQVVFNTPSVSAIRFGQELRDVLTADQQRRAQRASLVAGVVADPTGMAYPSADALRATPLTPERWATAKRIRDKPALNEELVCALVNEIERLRFAIVEGEGNIRSYLAHAGQDADHAFIVHTYLDPLRQKVVAGAPDLPIATGSSTHTCDACGAPYYDDGEPAFNDHPGARERAARKPL